MREKIQGFDINKFISIIKGKDETFQHHDIKNNMPQLSKEKIFRKNFLIGLTAIVCGAILVVTNDFKIMHQEGQKNLFFADGHILIGKSNMRYMENQTNLFLDIYKSYNVKEREVMPLESLVLLFGKLNAAALDINTPDSIYSYYSINPDKLFMEKNRKEYYSSATYKRNLEIQRMYLKKMINLIPSIEQVQERSANKISPLGKMVISKLLQEHEEELLNIVILSAYRAHYFIENAEMIHNIMADEKFDVTKLVGVTVKELELYWKDNFSQKYNMEEMPEYFKLMTISLSEEKSNKIIDKEKIKEFYLKQKESNKDIGV